MPLLNGIEAARYLSKSVPNAKLIFLTMHSEVPFVTEAFRAGASGYVLKRSAASELVTAIKEALKGRAYVTPLVAKDVLGLWLEGGAKPDRLFRELTPRQREVLQLVAEGRSIKEIATILNVSPKTVEFHKYRIMGQLGVRTTADVTKYAVKHGIVST
jgi:DNA-binding NarL/FixJ family response regulator